MLTGIPTVVDGGLSADTELPIGIPSNMAIPEPATWIITSMATVLLFVFRRGRRG
jgi:hypothetical protein